MNNEHKQPEVNKGASPVSHVSNGNPGDRGVLKDEQSETVSSKEEQRQYADNASQKYDECDRFDLDSLKGNVHNDRKGEAEDDK